MKDEDCYTWLKRTKQIELRRQHMQKLTSKRLVHLSLRKWGSINSSIAIAELNNRGTTETVKLAQKLFLSERWKRRALAIYIMCELKSPTDDYNAYAEEEASAASRSDLILLNSIYHCFYWVM